MFDDDVVIEKHTGDSAGSRSGPMNLAHPIYDITKIGGVDKFLLLI